MRLRVVHNRPAGPPIVPMLLLVAGVSFGVVTFALAPGETFSAIQTVLVRGVSGGYATSGACNIKGNVSQNSGERIYHVPGQEYYDETRISPEHGERWFCSEAEAWSAGWRKAKV